MFDVGGFPLCFAGFVVVKRGRDTGERFREEPRLAKLGWIERTHRRRRQRAVGKLTPGDFELLRRQLANAA
jgi:hypothetical protein